MEHVLKHRAEIYGLLALWIIVFHIDHDLINFPQIPILTNFIKIGNAGVDHFFFLSGYCIYLSLNRDSNVGNFLRKRFKRVVLVYLVIAIPFFIYKVVFETRTNVVANFFYDLSGLSFWFDKCRNVWFIHAIIVFYILTIPLYHLIKKIIGCGIFISKMKVPETLLATIGKLSLEVYLIHVIIVHICYSQKLETYLGYWAYLLVPLLAIPLSIAFHYFYEKNINKKQSN